jgi:predicted PurR-regulated permease PerM
MPKNNNHNRIQDIQLARIEESVKALKNEMEDFKDAFSHLMTNCIPTIQKTLTRVDANQKNLIRLVWSLIGAVGTLIGILIKLYFFS